MSKPMLTVEMEGLEELRGALRRLEAVARREVIEPALGEGGERIAQEARSRAPRRTGKGADTIGWQYREEGVAHGVYVGVGRGVKASRADGFYLRFLETGTAERMTKGKGATGRVPAGVSRGQVTPQPWLRPALDAVQEEAVRVVRERLRAAIDEAAP